MKHGTMGGYVQGQHIKTKSIISDENVQSKLREKLREMKDCDRTPGNFQARRKQIRRTGGKNFRRVFCNLHGLGC